MKQFTDERDEQWVATAIEEQTPRHHGKWYLVFHPANNAEQHFPVPEVRWQTAATAARTLRTMSDFELRRRLNSALERYGHGERDGKADVPRSQTNVSAG
jgi:hypothetical protein